MRQVGDGQKFIEREAAGRMMDDEREHTRNCMCALSRVKEDSITCNGGKDKNSPSDDDRSRDRGEQCLQVGRRTRSDLDEQRSEGAYGQG